MRRLLAVAVLLAACSPSDKPQEQKQSAGEVSLARKPMAAPLFSSVASVAAPYSADTSLYYIRYVLSKPLPGKDSVRIRFRRDSTEGVPATANVTRWSTERKDSAAFKTPRVLDKTASYLACVVIKHGGDFVNEKCTRWSTNFTTPVDTTPPVVDSLNVDSAQALIIRPGGDTFPSLADWHAKGVWYTDTATGTLLDSAGNRLPFTCPSGGARCPQRFYCAFVQFVDGKVALRAVDADKPVCSQEYTKLASSVRSVTSSQQAKADRMCVKWSVKPASAGTITAELCGSQT